jgi:Domain of unknown function (DUF4136)
MKTVRVAVGLIVFLMVCAIGLASVSVDWDKGANFAAYRTYTWGKGTPAKNPLWNQRIMDGVDNQLSAKGFARVDADASPDLIVVYHAAVGVQTEVNTMGTGGWGWRWGGGTATTMIEKIPTGQLSIDIGDAKTKKLLWLGTSSDTLSDNPEKNQKKLDNALEKMFKKFPPPVKK